MPHGTAACSPSYTGSLPADHDRRTMPGAAALTYRPAESTNPLPSQLKVATQTRARSRSCPVGSPLQRRSRPPPRRTTTVRSRRPSVHHRRPHARLHIRRETVAPRWPRAPKRRLQQGSDETVTAARSRRSIGFHPENLEPPRVSRGRKAPRRRNQERKQRPRAPPSSAPTEVRASFRPEFNLTAKLRE